MITALALSYNIYVVFPSQLNTHTPKKDMFTLGCRNELFSLDRRNSLIPFSSVNVINVFLSNHKSNDNQFSDREIMSALNCVTFSLC